MPGASDRTPLKEPRMRNLVAVLLLALTSDITLPKDPTRACFF
jgi:hypothetical protein